MIQDTDMNADFHNGPNLGLEPTTPRQVTYQNGWPVPAGWKLVPEGLIDFLDAKEHHLPVEDRHVLSIMLKAAPVAAQAPQDESPADILPPPGIHTAVHYAGWLRREAHRHQEPKASVLRQTARMLDVLQAECGRLHQELIDAQALQQDADPCPQCIPGGVRKTPTCCRLLAAQAPAADGGALLDALRKIAAWPDGGNRYGQENIKRFAQDVIDPYPPEGH